ncbi:MAG: methylmalonyl-CoA carboxyltransferase [Candidatus Dormibacteraeota bacterium]|nr:methylmalonyl-CoA carboxyltransferase [Candidatus Dormibacteraeota bacterium]
MGAQGPDSGPTAPPASERKLEQYRRRRREAAGTGSPGRPKAMHPRERIERLLDPGSFVELDMFATGPSAGAEAAGRVAGDGVVGGFGTVDGRQVAVYANDPALLGGAVGEGGAGKIIKVQDLALRTRIPIVSFLESTGPRVEEGVAALAGWASVLSRLARSSGVIPQIGVMAGPCGGDAIQALLLADFVFAVGRMPDQEVAIDRLAHFSPATEQECVARVRELLSHLPSSSSEAPPAQATIDAERGAEQKLQALAGNGHTYDVREVVRGILDGGRFLEVQPSFAANLVVGFGRLAGQAVGMVANQPAVLDGAVDAGAAAKAGRFVRVCDAFGVSIVSLVDTPGRASNESPEERAEILRQSARLLSAYARAGAPKLTVVLGRDSGDAYATMSPRQMGAEFSLAWPRARISARGGEEVESAYLAAERGLIDDVIEPRETRPALIRALQLCLRKPRGTS